MNEPPDSPRQANVRGRDEPLDPWMQARVAQAMSPADEAIPEALMWARIAKARARPATTPAPAISRWALMAGIAAVLVTGIGIGRFLLPKDRTSPEKPSVAAITSPPTVVSAARRSRMADHLQQTVSVLATVLAERADAPQDSVPRVELRRLLGTTRQLLDDPSLRDPRTHRLLEDLELVLAQLARARAAAPATRAAADEALHTTNLLPRLRAAAVSEARNGSEEL